MEKGLTLYNITNDFTDLMDKAESGEITEEEYNKLGTELATELQNKSTNIIAYVRNGEVFIEAVKAEEKRLSDMRKSAENKIEKFKKYVKENMERLDIQKIETELGNLSIAKSPISVDIIDETKIPDEYKEVVFTTKVDKKKIADNFKANGELIEGVEIHVDNTNLRIK